MRYILVIINFMSIRKNYLLLKYGIIKRNNLPTYYLEWKLIWVQNNSFVSAGIW